MVISLNLHALNFVVLSEYMQVVFRVVVYIFFPSFF